MGTFPNLWGIFEPGNFFSLKEYIRVEEIVDETPVRH
jgi:hypothetical protein